MGRVALVLAVVPALAVGTAFAASLPVTSNKLTTSTGASSVPISTCGPLEPTEDTYVDQFSPGSSFALSWELRVKSGALTNQRSLVKFDLATCSIPSTASVRSATLSLHLETAPGSSRTDQVFRITQSWFSGSATWVSQPSVSGAATVEFATGTSSGVTKSVSVLADVQAFVAGTQTNYGWRINDKTESDTGTAVYRSADWTTAAQRPKLSVQYYQ